MFDYRKSTFTSCLAQALCVLLITGMPVRHAHATPWQQSNPGSSKETVLLIPVEADYRMLSLPQITGRIAQRYHVSILIEGKPEPEPLSLQVKGTLKEALDTIANAFDYRWTLCKSGVILFNKRFQNIQAHPQILLSEQRQMVHDILKSLEIAPTSELSWDAQIKSLTSTFTPMQWDALRTQGHLFGASLSNAQLTLLARANYDNTFGEQVRAWTRLRRWLDSLDGLSIQYDPFNSKAGSPVLNLTFKDRQGNIVDRDTLLIPREKQQ
jgi:hypothetical protein